jgi:hypothetical protein
LRAAVPGDKVLLTQGTIGPDAVQQTGIRLEQAARSATDRSMRQGV